MRRRFWRLTSLGSPTKLPQDKRREIAPGFLASFNISLDDGNAIIMAARAHWFPEGEGVQDKAGAPASGEQA